MPVTDTRKKRSAALNFGGVASRVLPDADGSIDESDRAQLASGYYIAGDGSVRPLPPPNRTARVIFRSRTARFAA